MITDLRSFLLSLRNRHFMVIDLMILVVTPSLVIFLRMDSLAEFDKYAPSLQLYTWIMLLIKPLLFRATGLYNRYWPYASVDALRALVLSSAVALAVELALFFGVIYPLDLLPEPLPRSLPVLNAVMTMVLIISTRLSVRMLFELRERSDRGAPSRPVVIAGAGVAGAMVVKELATNPHVGLHAVAFLDDDPRKRGVRIHGVPVVGKLSDLPGVVKDFHPEEVIIAMPTAPGKVVRDVVAACKEAHVVGRTVPGVYEILSGTAKVSEIREIQIEDLLRRGSIRTDPRSVSPIIHKKRVMVTGAGGSIGSELCRQIALFGPSELILVGHGENSIFKIANDLKDRLPNSKIPTVIADIRDKKRMNSIFRTHSPQVIFHAAAHKHVGLMQVNVPEAITNNVLGTRNIAELAAQHNAERFVMISSDKAVNPTSVMGVTKRIAEMVVHDMAVATGRPFVSVRFGNVLGSRGSVVPIFKSQIASGGPVTVSDSRMTRYFMTIPEAVQLVLQAGAMGTGGEVYVLDMGEPIRILDLARDVIRLSGLTEGKDIDIVFTGLVPGEKLHEELFRKSERPQRSSHPKIFVCPNGAKSTSLEAMLEGTGVEGRGNMQVSGGDANLRQNVQDLIEAVQLKNAQPIQDVIKRLVPEYRPQGMEDEEWGSAAGSGREGQMRVAAAVAMDINSGNR